MQPPDIRQATRQFYEDLVGTLMAQFQSEPFVIAERYNFYCQNQEVGESLAQYIAEL